MGFGLTLSKMILQELGGEISIKSKPKKGSTFTFRIPVQKVDH
jgi:signal transduction histidine kinase